MPGTLLCISEFPPPTMAGDYGRDTNYVDRLELCGSVQLVSHLVSHFGLGLVSEPNKE
jgi:hypothetical protein